VVDEIETIHYTIIKKIIISIIVNLTSKVYTKCLSVKKKNILNSHIINHIARAF
jgi:hypothetical protein